MTAGRARSDQLYDWSARVGRVFGGSPAPATCCSTEEVAAPEGDSAWFGNRAVQAMREPGLPVRERSWTRSQAVPVRQPAWGTACDGVRARRKPRSGARIFGEPPTGTGSARGSLRDQPGAAASQRGAGVGSYAGGCSTRHRGRGRAGREHDPRSSGVGAIVTTFTDGSVGARAQRRFEWGVRRGREARAEGRESR